MSIYFVTKDSKKVTCFDDFINIKNNLSAGAKEQIEELSKQDSCVNKLIVLLTKFRRDNMVSLATASETPYIFEDGVFSSLVQKEVSPNVFKTVYNDIDNLEELIEAIEDSSKIVKTKKMEDISFGLTKEIEHCTNKLKEKLFFFFNTYFQNIETLKPVSLVNDTEEITNYREKMHRILYTPKKMTIHGFYGDKDCIGFPMHTDPSLVMMIPIGSNVDKNNYKSVSFTLEGKETDPIQIRTGDIVIMERDVPHRVTYSGSTDMISLAFEYSYVYETNDYLKAFFNENSLPKNN